ncbi:MAG: hypothetical protein JO168_24110 [Solirubrobacterales bacterium]|nr:hypothetical protein [Solirubrobacterales bacterium]
MDQEQVGRAHIARALKVGLPAAALGAGAVGAVAVAAGQSAAATKNTTITIQEPSKVNPVAILMPPDNAKPKLVIDTAGLTAVEQKALKNPINVLAFTFGLGTAQSGGAAVGKGAGAAPASETFNFTTKSGSRDAALSELVIARQLVAKVTLTAGSVQYVMVNVRPVTFSRSGKVVATTLTFQKIETTYTATGKGSTMVSSWNAPTAPPITAPFNIVVNKKA